MTLQTLTKLLQEFDTISFAYGQFPDSVEPPYISYRAEEENAIYGDGIKVYADEIVIMDVVTAKRDLRLEARLDALFENSDTQTKKSYEFDEEQKIHIVTYEFSAET